MRKDIFNDYERIVGNRDGFIRLDDEHEAYTRPSKYEEILLPNLVPLREKFRVGKYSLIIGEDASARVVTLITAKLIKKISNDTGAECPKTKFVRGFRYVSVDKSSLIEKQLEEWLKESVSRNILYVTESIGQGGSLANFLVACADAEAKADVIVAENYSNISDFRGALERLAGKEKIGASLGYLGIGPYVTEISQRPIILHDPHLSGVITKPALSRNASEGVGIVRKPVFAFPYKYNEFRVIAGTRKTADDVAENLYLELGPSLSELFTTIDIPYSQLETMDGNDRALYEYWVKMVGIRISCDPRIDKEKFEHGIIEHDLFGVLRYFISISRDSLHNNKKYDVREEYKNILDKLKLFLSELEHRPYN